MPALSLCSSITRSVNSKPLSFSEMLGTPQNPHHLCGRMVCVYSRTREGTRRRAQLNVRPTTVSPETTIGPGIVGLDPAVKTACKPSANITDKTQQQPWL